jgi:hypothetical protein
MSVLLRKVVSTLEFNHISQRGVLPFTHRTQAPSSCSPWRPADCVAQQASAQPFLLRLGFRVFAADLGLSGLSNVLPSSASISSTVGKAERISRGKARVS